MAEAKKRPRKRFTERETLETAIRQGAVILCYRCRMPFDLGKFLLDAEGRVTLHPNYHWVGFAQREHLHEFGFGGPDTPANCRYSCEASHKIVTHGTKATSAGSSKHRMAKADRIARGGNKPRGRKLKSRGFDKTLRRTMAGKVEKRHA